jgi:hypothetical protein
MAVVKIAQAANFVWGIPSGQQYQALGRNVSVSVDRTAETETLDTIEGETDGMVLYNKANEVTVEAILPVSGIGTLDVGSTVTVAGYKIVVKDLKRQWQQKGWARVTLTGSKPDTLSI